ncbi:hypothetical protein CEXT_37101 [Caerostris extrusa]|uniref:Uncharacterized protein n=1 Tax=Caerostris extrusa TaxID=172846 RepID=A0AAV4YEE7_CAEEX|nr:hypothetical protein CEXT_37101 [Caerostris extrusa]
MSEICPIRPSGNPTIKDEQSSSDYSLTENPICPFGNSTIKDEQSSTDYVRDMSKHCILLKIPFLNSDRKANWTCQQSKMNKAPLTMSEICPSTV